MYALEYNKGKQLLKSKRILIMLLKIFVSIGLMTYLLYKVGITSILSTVRSANIYYFLFALSIVIGGVILCSYKWQILLSTQDVRCFLPILISFYFIGMFFSNFLPTIIGGDIVRVYNASKYSKKGIESLASVFMERATGLFALILIAVIALIFGHKSGISRNIAFVIIALFVGYSFFLMVLFNKHIFGRFTQIFRLSRISRFGNKIREMYNSICIYKEHKEVLSKALAISFVFQTMSVIAIYIISLSLGVKISLLYFFLFVPIINILTMLPISLNGIGIREGAFMFFFTKIGTSNTQAFSMSILAYAIVLLTSLIGGVIYAVRR